MLGNNLTSRAYFNITYVPMNLCTYVSMHSPSRFNQNLKRGP